MELDELAMEYCFLDVLEPSLIQAIFFPMYIIELVWTIQIII